MDGASCRWRLSEGVEHGEIVNCPQISNRGHRHTGLAQAVSIGLPFVPEYVEFVRHDKRWRQPSQLFDPGAQG